MYRIVRFYESANIRRRTIATPLTLEDAKAYCSDPETSSETCTNPVGKARTKRIGRWFDGFEEIR
jgi:hypothetical protein